MTGHSVGQLGELTSKLTSGFQLFMAFVLAFGWVTVLPSSVFAGAEDIQIREFKPDPVTIADANGEWIELYNSGDTPVDLTGWTINLNSRNAETDTIDSGTIAPGDFFVLCNDTNPITNGGVECDAQIADTIINLGGAVTETSIELYDNSPTPILIDSVTYTSDDVNEGESIVVNDEGELENDSRNEYNEDGGNVDFGTPGESAPTTPDLESPADEAYVSDNLVSFDWSESTDLDEDEITYTLEISTNSSTELDGSFTATVRNETNLTSSEHTLTTELPSGLYYWHVMATDENDNESEWSDTWEFTVDDVMPVTNENLFSPLDESIWTSDICVAGYTSDNEALSHVNIYARYENSTSDFKFVKEATLFDELEDTLPDECSWLLDEILEMSEELEEDGDGSFWYAIWNPQSEAPFKVGEAIFEIKVSGVDEAGNEEDSAYANNVVWDVKAPTVDAGPDLEECVQFTRTGKASDNGSGLRSVKWSVVSGPGRVTLGSPSQLTTTIEADEVGTYVIRLTATDKVGNTSFDDFTLNWVDVPAATDSQGSPTHVTYTSTSSGNNSQDSSNQPVDSDGDGFSDEEEVAQGTDPNDPNDNPDTVNDQEDSDSEEDVLADTDDDFNILWLLVLAGVIGLLYFLLSRREAEQS